VFFGPVRDDYPLPPALLVVLVVLIGLFPETMAGPWCVPLRRR
jgi:multicomponent K+:H+ antiporter subunit A